MSKYCPKGKMACERSVVDEESVLGCIIEPEEGGAMPVWFNISRCEVCPFPSLQKPIEEKIVLELTPKEAKRIHWSYNEGPLANESRFDVSLSRCLKDAVYSSLQAKINKLAEQWEEDRK